MRRFKKKVKKGKLRRYEKEIRFQIGRAIEKGDILKARQLEQSLTKKLRRVVIYKPIKEVEL